MKIALRIVVFLSLCVLVQSRTFLTPEDIADEYFEHDRDEPEMAMGRPSIFTSNRGTHLPCHENGVVASWCDEHLDPNLQCIIFPAFDTYGCSCIGDASLCPDDCVGGVAPVERTHYGISCTGIPQDEPNYILRERHPLNRCENNAVVASWCDDYVNPHLECALDIVKDEYSCKCSGRVSACPDECVGGEKPSLKVHGLVRCQGIPLDQPNYILKEE